MRILAKPGLQDLETANADLVAAGRNCADNDLTIIEQAST